MVPTPLGRSHEPDLSFIEATAEAIVPYLRARQLVVLEAYVSGHDRRAADPIWKEPAGLKAARGDEDTANTFLRGVLSGARISGHDGSTLRHTKVVGG